jgi:hypothetical protein
VCYGERFCKPEATNQIQKFPRKVFTFTVLSRRIKLSITYRNSESVMAFTREPNPVAAIGMLGDGAV